jgi:hypothetical protein
MGFASKPGAFTPDHSTQNRTKPDSQGARACARSYEARALDGIDTGRGLGDDLERIAIGADRRELRSGREAIGQLDGVLVKMP